MVSNGLLQRKVKAVIKRDFLKEFRSVNIQQCLTLTCEWGRRDGSRRRFQVGLLNNTAVSGVESFDEVRTDWEGVRMKKEALKRTHILERLEVRFSWALLFCRWSVSGSDGVVQFNG